MEAGAELEGDELTAGEAQFFAEADTVSDDALGVAFRLFVAGVERECKRACCGLPVGGFGFGAATFVCACFSGEGTRDAV